MEDLLITIIAMLLAGLGTLATLLVRSRSKQAIAGQKYEHSTRTTQDEIHTKPDDTLDVSVFDKLERERAKYLKK